MNNRSIPLVLLAALTALGSVQATAATSANLGYVLDPAGSIVRNGTGGCWQTIFWTPALAVPGCEGVAAKAELKTAQQGSAAASQSKENWKTILTEKPVRLEGANFATSSAKLLQGADVKLNEVVNAAKQYPEIKLEVSGHTDSRGKKAFNQKLSEQRAAAVKAWLVKHGVAAVRIHTAGYAYTQAIGDNKTEAGRAANRRVEVRYAIKEEKKVRVPE